MSNTSKLVAGLLLVPLVLILFLLAQPSLPGYQPTAPAVFGGACTSVNDRSAACSRAVATSAALPNYGYQP
jgi:hypothetical protein